MPTIYAALDDRLLVASDRDGAWSAEERLVGTDVECVAAGAGRPDLAVAGTVADGLYRTADGGETWDRTFDVRDRVTAVAVDPRNPDVVWAGTEPSRVYRSTDAGETWTERPGLTDLPSADEWSFPPRPHTHHVRWIEVDPADSDRLYVAIEAGALVRTPDAGETWIDRPEGSRRDNHTVRTHPDAPDRVYVAAGDGYAESTDGGDTWERPQSGLDHRYVWGLAVHPEDPDLVFVSAADGPRDAHDPRGRSVVYRRADDGWERAMEGLPGPEGTARAVLAAGEGRCFALTNRGLFETDRGRSWTPLPIEWSEEYAGQVPRGLAVAP